MPRITLFFTILHVFVMIALLAPISLRRRSQRIGLGAGDDKVLQRMIRAHGNFVENVPIALLLLGLLELGGMPSFWLWIFGWTLLLARVMHAIGLWRSPGTSFGRFWGAALTWLDLLAMAVAGIWLLAVLYL